MKKTFFILAACAVTMIANAQILEVVSMQQLPAASYDDARVAGVSPDGNYVLMTTGSNQGLKRYDIATDKLLTLSQAASAGFDVQISRDGKEIVYGERTFHADRTSSMAYVHTNMQTNHKVMLNEQQAASAFATKSNVVLTNDEGTMYVIKNGKRILVAPFGTKERIYIWTSLSPDQTKICYYLGDKGCYVCDIDGKNNRFIGYDCRAAQWYDNNTLIAQYDKDDGRFITASAIVAYTLDGKYQVLTSPDMIAMDPYTANGKIVFSTIQGKTYMLNVK